MRPAPHTAVAAILDRARVAAGGSNVTTLEDFRAANPMSFVGRLHNAAVLSFMRGITTTHKSDYCGAMKSAWRTARESLGADSVKVAANYGDVSRMAISKNAKCDGNGRSVRRASVDSPLESSAVPRSTSAMSGDPVPYLDAIEAAQLAATSGSGLIAVVDAIVDDAGIYLTGVELEAVEAVASIAVETYDLWVTDNHVQAVAESLQPI